MGTLLSPCKDSEGTARVREVYSSELKYVEQVFYFVTVASSMRFEAGGA